MRSDRLPDDFTLLAELMEAADARIIALDAVRSKMAGHRAALHEHLVELSRMALEMEARFYRLPKPPPIPPINGKWDWSGEDFIALWRMMNKVSQSSISLSDGSTIDEFIWQVGEMEQDFRLVDDEERHAKKAIMARDRHAGEMRLNLASNLIAIPRTIPPHHSIRVILANWPKRSDVSASPSILRGQWDAMQEAVHLEWKAAQAANLQRYEVRQCSRRTYDPAWERVVWRGSETSTWITPWFGPGATMRFRLYAVLDKDIGIGSNAVSVTRPFP